MQHLLDIKQLTSKKVNELIRCAMQFKMQSNYPQFTSSPLATLFYENSTRTRVSFELAAKHLGMPVVNVDLQSSSETKGEAVEDTFRTLAAMGIQCFVIRHSQDGMPARLAKQFGKNIHVVNAGDGQHAHPSQALIDFMTITEKKPALDRLKIAVIGDVRHSRVAHSFQALSALMGVGELVFVAPTIWQPTNIHYGRVTSSLKEGLANADVVMCLRVQRERLLETDQLDLTFFREHYALTVDTLRYAKEDAIVMHPGPMNRGVEIDSEVADGRQSVIFQQVNNGVFMRMAILDQILTQKDEL